MHEDYLTKSLKFLLFFVRTLLFYFNLFDVVVVTMNECQLSHLFLSQSEFY